MTTLLVITSMIKEPDAENRTLGPISGLQAIGTPTITVYEEVCDK